MKFLISAVTLFCCLSLFAQSNPEWRSWNRPVEPFRIVGNVYYVGANEITAFLITSPKGHILLDGGFAETAPQIRDNIRKLGFQLTDVKYLLNSQAHFDHAAGLSQLKTWSGAKVVASKGDSAQLAAGGKGDFAWGDKFQYSPVPPDRIIANGETVAIGATSMTAHITPGHTKGCTTWTTAVTEDGRTFNVVFVCSLKAPGYSLVHNSRYPGIVQDFRSSFATLKSLPCDVLLGSHGSFFDLTGKRKQMIDSPGANPFVNAQACRQYAEAAQLEFESELKKQQP